jgi:hypothetical protein
MEWKGPEENRRVLTFQPRVRKFWCPSGSPTKSYRPIIESSRHTICRAIELHHGVVEAHQGVSPGGSPQGVMNKLLKVSYILCKKR